MSLNNIKQEYSLHYKTIEHRLKTFYTKGKKSIAINSKLLNFDIEINNDLKKQMDKKHILLRSHGYVQLKRIENNKSRIDFFKVPSNICVYFLSPLGCQISNDFNKTSKNFFNNSNKIKNF